MNGFEHQVAGHMIWEGMMLEGLAVERAVHDRYHASRRNPWNEIECGDHYARSMASYGVYLAACGFEYHGPKAAHRFRAKAVAGEFQMRLHERGRLGELCPKSGRGQMAGARRRALGPTEAPDDCACGHAGKFGSRFAGAKETVCQLRARWEAPIDHAGQAGEDSGRVHFGNRLCLKAATFEPS